MNTSDNLSLSLGPIAQAMPHPLWIADCSGGPLDFNRRWLDFTGFEKAYCLRLGWTGILEPSDQQRIDPLWKSALKTLTPFEVEGRLRDARGQGHWMLIRANPIQDPAGHEIGWCGTCTELQRFKNREAALLAS